MTERERLVEMIGSKVCEDYSPNCDEWQPHSCEKCYANDCRIGDLADYFLANGVIIPPCKVGDTVYYIYNNTIIEYQVNTIIIYKYSQRIVVWGRSQYFEFSDFGKTVFLTRKEAEKALEEMKKND